MAAVGTSENHDKSHSQRTQGPHIKVEKVRMHSKRLNANPFPDL